MTNIVRVNQVSAFVNTNGEYGNPTGIILDLDQSISKEERQTIAAKLKYTDTVYVNSLDTIRLSFHNPEQETKFAGDSLVSTAYFVRHVLNKQADNLFCAGGEIRSWEEGGITWIEASLEGTPGWQHRQLESGDLVDTITEVEAAKFEHTMVWAWIDEKRGVVRSRTFLPDWGTLEDQGNGSGSMQLAAIVGRDLEIHQGKGSVIYASPSIKGMVKVGGRVRVDGPKQLV